MHTLSRKLLLAAIVPALLVLGSPGAHAEAATAIANPLDGLNIVKSPVDPSTLLQLWGMTQTFSKVALQASAHLIVPLDQYESFDQIISHESSWQIFAINPTSGAYGLAQALPAHKMFSEGPDWMFNPITQLRWAYRYMCERYGNPNAAWAFWQAHNWY
ncbi:transglycosylase SLT domain-containing protein [Nocardia sp. NBC_00511]|uniref:aggregation-promoting factor C-terminal-like domain-containing protein n=1 Tax=Nocardia sp. NBC_00511 TaxID=2903591 RepID=UPI0030E2C8FD